VIYTELLIPLLALVSATISPELVLVLFASIASVWLLILIPLLGAECVHYVCPFRWSLSLVLYVRNIS